MPEINVKSTQTAGVSNRVAISAEESARAEFRLRKMLNERTLREEERLRKDNLRAEAKLNAETLREEKRLRADKLRAEKEAQREEARQERARISEQRRAQRAEEQRQRTFTSRVEKAAALGGVIGAASRGDFAGAVGMVGGAAGGALGEALAGPIGAAVGIAIGELIGKLAFPAQSIYGAAKTAADLQIGTYALGRAGGFSGAGFFGQFAPGKNFAPDAMRRIGATPGSLMGSLSSYGIVPRGDAMGTALAFGGLGLTPGFSAMPGGTAEGLARQGVGYGAAANSTAGVQQYDMRFARLLEAAVAGGMDRSKVLDAAQTSLDTLAKSGAMSLSPQDAINLLFRTMQTGTPGGRTGMLAANVVAGQAGVMGDVVRNQLTSSLLIGQLPKYGNLKSRADVERFVGHGNLPPKVVSMITSAAQAGNMQVALEYASILAMGSPGRLETLVGPGVAGITGGRDYLNPLVMSQALGISRADALALSMVGPGAVMGAGGAGGALSESSAQAAIKRLFPGAVITSGLRSAARNKKVGGVPTSYHLKGQALDFIKPKGQSLGSIRKALSAAGLPTKELLDEGSHIHWAWGGGAGGAGVGGANIPTQAFQLQTQAGQQDLFTSNIALQNLGGVADGAAKAIDRLASAASRAATAISSGKFDMGPAHIILGPTGKPKESVWDKWNPFGP